MYDEVKMRISLAESFNTTFNLLCDAEDLLDVENVDLLVDKVFYSSLRLGCSEAEREDIRATIVRNCSGNLRSTTVVHILYIFLFIV